MSSEKEVKARRAGAAAGSVTQAATTVLRAAAPLGTVAVVAPATPLLVLAAPVAAAVLGYSFYKWLKD